MCLKCAPVAHAFRILDVVQVRDVVGMAQVAKLKGVVVAVGPAKAKVLFLDGLHAIINFENLIRLGPAIGE